MESWSTGILGAAVAKAAVAAQSKPEAHLFKVTRRHHHYSTEVAETVVADSYEHSLDTETVAFIVDDQTVYEVHRSYLISIRDLTMAAEMTEEE